ncbi:MAG: hypothetical protein COA74_09515 [Gammaproteobacteria bacterium]|nr:MAG: hypothetical protein COA74_09515 [Gammaproteobacteria bacterium]
MKLENIFLTLVEMIEEYNILLFTIFGWIVIFIINKHFFKKNKQNITLNKIIEITETIQNRAFDFWLNERIVSSNNDLTRLTQMFRRCRTELDNIPKKHRMKCIELLSNARKTLTFTPLKINDFTTMIKTSDIHTKRYNDGCEHLETLHKTLKNLK